MLTLVLGGGAAKGYAHIGVIKYLEQLNFKPELIVGASMGAVIGGFYAAGFSIQEIENIALKIDKKTKRHLFPFRLSKKGLFKAHNIVKFFKRYLGDMRIEDCAIQYAVVTTDIEHHSEIIITKGRLIDAIRAAISIPAVFVPYTYRGHVLVDGGFISPVPITAAQQLGATRTVAVNVLNRVKYPHDVIRTAPASGASYSMKKVLIQIIDYATSHLIDFQEKQLKKGIVINIDTQGVGLSQFEKARDAIEKGYAQTRAYDDALRSLIN
jgi:NTE family protein